MRTDILLDNDLDFVITDNDLTFGESDAQHGKLLLATIQGDWTQYPKTGVGLVQYLKGSFDGEARRNVRLQFEGDGYKVDELSFDPNSGATNINFS